MSKPNRHVLPGFSLSLGYTLLYLSLLVIVPLAACFGKAFSLSAAQFWAAVWTPRTIGRLSLHVQRVACCPRSPASCWAW